MNTHKMTARQLREAGLLWPQVLTDAELEQELNACDERLNPIAWRMLCDESKHRRNRIDPKNVPTGGKS